MIRIALAVIGLVAVVLVVVIWQAQRRWEAATNDMRQRLVDSACAENVTRYSEAELAGLPAPVVRYFRAALKEGQAIVKHARVSWQGEFNMGRPGADNWAPFTAVQDFAPCAPGFIWDARIAMRLGLTTMVRDSFVAGAGTMLGKVMGVVTVVDSHSTLVIALSALQRFLGEAMWFPTALLPSQGVRWEAIDATRARASINAAGLSTWLEFRFGTDGLVQSVYTPARTFDDGKSAPSVHPWQAYNLRYGEFSGMKVPVESTAQWLLPAGAHAYWRGRPAHIDYRYAANAAAR